MACIWCENARKTCRVSSWSVSRRCLEGCATVRVVASLKPFPSLAGFREELPREMVETSWRAPEEVQQAGAIEQPGSLMYIYRRVAVGIVAASSPSCDAHVTSQAPAAPG